MRKRFCKDVFHVPLLTGLLFNEALASPHLQVTDLKVAFGQNQSRVGFRLGNATDVPRQSQGPNCIRNTLY